MEGTYTVRCSVYDGKYTNETAELVSGSLDRVRLYVRRKYQLTEIEPNVWSDGYMTVAVDPIDKSQIKKV